eukprot:GHUV01046522.1.p1 GENE.GHUV01046522.1~~GHUV01046522.1.p1  ORF type:complete len:250 (-),score=36.33 GHUV01046522.1:119-868(-)
MQSPTTAKTSSKITDQKPTVIITGASSGLGLNAAAQLAKSGDWHVIMACRDYSKAEMAAKKMGMPAGSYTVMHLDLASLNSVRNFVEAFRNSERRLDAVVCNAAVYLPTAKEPTFTPDGFELSVGTNHLGHFLLARMLLEDLNNSPSQAPRYAIVFSPCHQLIAKVASCTVVTQYLWSCLLQAFATRTKSFSLARIEPMAVSKGRDTSYLVVCRSGILYAAASTTRVYTCHVQQVSLIYMCGIHLKDTH